VLFRSPKGRYDDQVDSTAMFLEWFKTANTYTQMYDLMRLNAPRLCLQPPQPHPGSHVAIASGELVPIKDGTVELPRGQAQYLIDRGWTVIDTVPSLDVTAK